MIGGKDGQLGTGQNGAIAPGRAQSAVDLGKFFPASLLTLLNFIIDDGHDQLLCGLVGNHSLHAQRGALLLIQAAAHGAVGGQNAGALFAGSGQRGGGLADHMNDGHTQLALQTIHKVVGCVAGNGDGSAAALLQQLRVLTQPGVDLLGAAVGGPIGAGIGASIAGAGGAASGDTYLGERLAMDDRLSEAEKERAYEEGKMSEMGVNAAVNAIPFGGAAAVRAGRTALAAAGRGTLGRKAAEGAAAFARGGAWRTAADTASYAERFGGLAGEAAEQAVAKAAMRPIAADLVRQSERGVMGGIKYNAVPEAAMASGLNAGAMLESNVHYNELTGQNDSITQNVPEAAAMGLLFGIPAGIGGAIRSRRMAAELTSPETRLAGHQQSLERDGKVGENLPAPVRPEASSDSGTPGTPGTGPRRPSGDGGAGEPGEAAGAASPFTDEQLGRIREMWSRRGEWYDSVKDRWESDTEFQSAYQDLDRQMKAKNPDLEAMSRARDRFSSVLGRFMLRDEEIISGGRNAGPRPEAANGERGFSEARESATVFDTEPARERRAGQADTGAGGALGTYPQNAAGTDASGVPAPAGVRNPQDPGSGTGGGTGGSTPALENSAGSIGIAWAGRQPNGKRAVGKSGAGPAAAVRTAADQGAGGAQPPAEPVAGSAPSGRGTPPKLLEKWDRQKSDAAAAKRARGRLSAAGGKRTKSVAPVADALLRDYGVAQRGVARLIERSARGKETFTDTMKSGLANLARHYNTLDKGVNAVPAVYSTHMLPYEPGTPARALLDRLNDIVYRKELGGESVKTLRFEPFMSEGWLADAASLINGEIDRISDNSIFNRATPEELAHLDVLSAFKRDVFPDRWKSGKPVEVADISEVLDPKKTLEKDFDATNDGTPFCAR